MAAYVEHAAYYVNQMDWYLNFFQQVFQMQVQKQRQGADGLREVWLEGGVQLCETTAPALEDGRCAHLCLIVEDLEQAREKGPDCGGSGTGPGEGTFSGMHPHGKVPLDSSA